jgi:O-antigen/teichoic acid export membrane protein
MGILTATLVTVDRWLVGAFLGLGALGGYGFAVSLSELGVSLAVIVRTVILRDVYGKDDSSGDFIGGRTLNRPLAGFANVAPLLAGAIAIALPWGLDMFMTEYRSVAPVALLLLFCGIAQGMINIAVLGITAEGQQHLLPAISIGAVCISAALSLGALLAGLGVEGVAGAALVARLLYAAATIVLLARVQRLSSSRVVVRTLAPLSWCIVVAVALNRLLPVNNFERLVEALLLYLAGVLPLLPLAKRALASRQSVPAPASTTR